MRKIIYLGLMLIFVLSSCSIDWNDEKGKKIIELENKLKDNFFEKNKECISFESEMRKQLDSYERYGSRGDGATLYLSEIFYSPALNSCLYKSEFILGDIYNLEINDYFSKKVVFAKSCIFSNSDINLFGICSDDFNNKIKELKGE